MKTFYIVTRNAWGQADDILATKLRKKQADEIRATRMYNNHEIYSITESYLAALHMTQN